MNSLDLNIDHRCSNELPAHFIFILTGFSPWVNVYDMMIISCFDLSKTQSILFSLLWCSFDVGVYSSDLTIEAESCCIFSDFFGRYVKQDNRCRFVRRPSLSPISWLNDRFDALELICRSWHRLCHHICGFSTQWYDDLNIYVKMMKSFNILIFNPFFLILSCHCWRWFL